MYIYIYISVKKWETLFQKQRLSRIRSQMEKKKQLLSIPFSRNSTKKEIKIPQKLYPLAIQWQLGFTG